MTRGNAVGSGRGCPALQHRVGVHITAAQRRWRQDLEIRGRKKGGCQTWIVIAEHCSGAAMRRCLRDVGGDCRDCYRVPPSESTLCQERRWTAARVLAPSITRRLMRSSQTCLTRRWFPRCSPSSPTAHWAARPRSAGTSPTCYSPSRSMLDGDHQPLERPAPAGVAAITNCRLAIRRASPERGPNHDRHRVDSG